MLLASGLAIQTPGWVGAAAAHAAPGPRHGRPTLDVSSNCGSFVQMVLAKIVCIKPIAPATAISVGRDGASRILCDNIAAAGGG